MASLDQFLQDLDDLDDEQAEGADEEVQDEELDEDEDIDMVGEDVQPASTSGLLASGRLDELIERIEDLMVQTGPIDSEAEYSAIVACNEMVIDADTEVMSIAKSIKDDYAKRFPELESLIPNPLDYARVVLKLGNETDLTQVDLTGILPSASIMVVTVTASTTAGTALPEAALQKVQDACEQVLKLSSHKQKMLAFVESRMSSVAPNLSAIVGTQVAAKLIGAAGGLDKLAALPSTVLQVLGSKKRTGAALGGMSSNSGLEVKHAGFVQRCDLIQNTPPQLRAKVMRLVAGKCTLACRADSYGDSKDGEIGERFKEDIEQKAIKMQEPPPPKEVKALPIPPEASGKRRGGRRLRKMKERFGMTQMRQLSNRVQFGQEEDTTSDGLLGVGMLSAKSGKMRVSAKEQKLAAEKNKKRQNSSSGATNGLASSLAFTPVQGIELVNPTANRDAKEGTETYFSQTAQFFQSAFS